MSTSGIRLAVVVAVALAGGATATACADRREAPAGPTTTATVTPSPSVRTTPTTRTTPAIQASTIQSRLFTLRFDVVPAKVGPNQFHVYANLPDGQAANIAEWRVAAVNPAVTPEPIVAAVLPVTADHAVGQIDLPVAAQWRFIITVRGRGTAEDVAYADINVT